MSEGKGQPIWHLLTGEYPPDCGGVSDYTEQLACGLASRGYEVHVWKPCRAVDLPPPGISCKIERVGEGSLYIHSVSGGFSRHGLRTLDSALDEFSERSIVFVQYAPNAFGCRGMNVHFCRWLLRRSHRGDDIRVMFHEPYFYFTRRRLRRNLLAVVQRAMAALVLAASSRVYMSTLAWEPYLRPYDWRRTRPLIWLPVPSTLQRVQNPTAVQSIRLALTGNSKEARIIGHFGTYGDTELVENVLLNLLEANSRVIVQLIGNESDRYARSLAQQHPSVSSRIRSTGYLTAAQVSLHLQACDILIQPYRDGATTRRTTLMAGLMHGIATITNRGALSEPLWKDSGLAVASRPNAAEMLQIAQTLMTDDEKRQAIAGYGEQLYSSQLSWDRSIDQLITDSRESVTAGI